MDGSINPVWNGVFSSYPNEASLAELFMANVQRSPHAIALQDGPTRITYIELASQASQVAHALHRRGVRCEDPIGVLMSPGVGQVVAQVACAMIGATCVPLDPDYPPERLQRMLAAAQACLVITDDSAMPVELAPQVAGLCMVRQHEELASLPREFEVVKGGAEKCTHILYTSGSTGQPKGIAIVGRAINRLLLATDYVQINANDRVAHIASFTFDACLFEVWGALLHGAAIVRLPRSAILDPQAFAGLLRSEAVSVMFLTTALFNFTAQANPLAFADLRCLMVGGERANPQTMRAVMNAGPPQQFLHAYGPTEATTFTTMHCLSLAEVEHPTVAIGRPIRNSSVYILDESFRAVGVGVEGEMFVGGDGLARGYVNDDELTRERFVWVDGLQPQGAIRLYRTGDLAKWRDDGAIEFIGRRDFQIKLRGYRIELEEVEAALIASGFLNAAAVAVEGDPLTGDVLVAHIVPQSPADFRLADLQHHLRSTLPAYMVPARFRERESLPVHAHGKVDRAALRKLPTPPVPNINPPHSGSLEVAITTLWAELLEVPELSENDDFFQLGGDSLRAAWLMLRVRECFDVDLAFSTLYSASRLGQFITAVRQARSGGPAIVADDDGPEIWRRDAMLPADLENALLSRSGASVTPLVDARTIVLTGATGFLGAFLLNDLLRNTDATVLCLVRSRDVDSGGKRLIGALQKYGLWEPDLARRIVPLPGDLEAPRLGLDVDTFSAVATAADHIFHVAAKVHYVASYAAHHASNVLGTQEVLQLAAAGRAVLHHVSTIAVFGPTGLVQGTKVIAEDEPLDRHVDSLRFDIGYSRSKWVAEQMVWAASRLGLPVTVYRPGFILGDSQHGRGDIGCFVARLLRGCIQIGAYPELPEQRKELVTVDYASAAIAKVAASADSIGCAFHLVPPTSAGSPDMEELFTQLSRCGYPLDRLAYADWVQRLRFAPELAENPLCPLLPMLIDPIGRDRTAWQFYEKMPRYLNNRLYTLLGTAAPTFHPMTESLLRKHLDHWQAVDLHGTSADRRNPVRSWENHQSDPLHASC